MSCVPVSDSGEGGTRDGMDPLELLNCVSEHFEIGLGLEVGLGLELGVKFRAGVRGRIKVRC